MAQMLIWAQERGVYVQGEGGGKQDSFFGGCPYLDHLQMIMKPQPKLICIRVWISVLCEIQSITLYEVSAIFLCYSTLSS